ncbi:hypothetical protein FIBSPDRAFT_884224 [Athelia psychrophila]|uniref:Uncharacterized protein n=1 Tax=Athelia psychrophila TaxID=1759441 RepID=A0A166T865_9AGAM|nr:hypothetical protein FIBSPDRAFT_884224 [Fibularhizoctonia sp. CBS 109695]
MPSESKGDVAHYTVQRTLAKLQMVYVSVPPFLSPPVLRLPTPSTRLQLLLLAVGASDRAIVIIVTYVFSTARERLVREWEIKHRRSSGAGLGAMPELMAVRGALRTRTHVEVVPTAEGVEMVGDVVEEAHEQEGGHLAVPEAALIPVAWIGTSGRVCPANVTRLPTVVADAS